MRISHYHSVFARGENVDVYMDGSAVTIDAPSTGNPERGPLEDMSAAETVELHRALTAWLARHKYLHRQWHADYRERDPGGASPGRRRRQRGRREEELDAQTTPLREEPVTARSESDYGDIFGDRP